MGVFKKLSVGNISLFSLLLIFLILRFPYLNLHYFWDEAWVYGPAVQYLAEHTPNFLPSSLPDAISRGHPLFFHTIFGIFGKIFGAKPFVFHAFAWLISAGVLISVYFILRCFTSTTMAIIGSLVLLLQTLFLAQSNLVLPEVLLGGLILIALFFYAINKEIFFSISLGLALLTKETATVLPIAIGVYELGRLVIKDIHVEVFLKKIGYLLLAFIPVGVFFAVQFIQRGYVFFPEHVGLIQLDWDSFRYFFILGYDNLFEAQGRKWLVIVAYASLILFSPYKWWQKMLLFFAGFAMVKIFFNYWVLPTLVSIPLLILIFVGFYFYGVYNNLKTRLNNKNEQWKTFVSISFIFSLLYLQFSAINFFTIRYLTAVLILLIPVAMIVFFHFLPEEFFIRYLIPLALIIPIGKYLYNPNPTIGDSELNYTDALQVQQKVFDFIQEEGMQENSFFTSFTDYETYSNPNSGLVKVSTSLKSTNMHHRKRDYWIFQNYEASIDPDTIPNLELDTLKTFKVGQAKAFLTIPVFQQQ